MRFSATLKVMGTHVAITVGGLNCHIKAEFIQTCFHMDRTQPNSAVIGRQWSSEPACCLRQCHRRFTTTHSLRLPRESPTSSGLRTSLPKPQLSGSRRSWRLRRLTMMRTIRMVIQGSGIVLRRLCHFPGPSTVGNLLCRRVESLDLLLLR